ncbi:DUF4186 domain-containing protein [Gluconobacter kanchanaburiensis]|uniref:DUF4186 domain-containing protein n=1 Tax=Gluconobacter kanchanaburiensis TaxID=563199 RepID=UPI0011BDA34D|nr:DUF4186 domain-containing protein [Gluconobacter kanchanaburiensis]MBF0862481.1 DUF4186 family protein [Gluconobacter kanchanaburiensis]
MNRFDPAELFERLSRSRFRARFHLDDQARLYLESRGLDAVIEHGATFIAERLAPAHPPQDGKQTPMRGHPVFIAQHATGSCCRTCLSKWHSMAPGQALTAEQQARILLVLRHWIERDFGGSVPKSPAQGALF